MSTTTDNDTTPGTSHITCTVDHHDRDQKRAPRRDQYK
jgi:hypothetical protein